MERARDARWLVENHGMEIWKYWKMEKHEILMRMKYKRTDHTQVRERNWEWFEEFPRKLMNERRLTVRECMR